MRRPLQVRWRLARSMLKFTGHTGPRAWLFIIQQIFKR